MREAASFIASRTGAAPEGLLAALAHQALAALRAWNNRRHLSRLSDLDDHLLADLGISREDVRWALDLPFSYDPGIELQKRAMRSRQCRWRG